jgi:hypothetical protein
MRAGAAVLSVSALAASATVSTAAGVITPTTDPAQLAQSVVVDSSWVTGAAIVTSPPGGTTTGLVTGDFSGFPTHGPDAIILSTGHADSYTHGISTDLGGGTVRGNTDYDVTILRIDLDVPVGVNCLLGMDFRFLSMEWPEFVGTQYNDAFIAEVGESTWTTSGSEITAPGNFAFDPTGSPISINAAGVTSMTPEHAADTPFAAHAATPALTAATPLEPGPTSLFLSIFDQGDRILDSAVVIDNLRLGQVADPATQCIPGATPVDPTPTTFDLDVAPDQINLRSKGVTPMTIFGSEELDVTQLDASTLRVGPAEAAPEKWHHTDENGDGYMDLKFHVRTQSLGLQTTDTQITVTVSTLDGTVLTGSDDITVRD